MSLSPDSLRAHCESRLPIADDSYERSVLAIRSDPDLSGFVEKNYLAEDLFRASERYRNSDEFAHVSELLGGLLTRKGAVLDVGAGRGLCSLALASHGLHTAPLCAPSRPPLYRSTR